jgi:hypothetical protein
MSGNSRQSRSRTGARPGLIGLALAAAACLSPSLSRAGEPVPEPTAAPHRHAAQPRPRRSGLEDRVERLSRALELDAKQRTALRKLLEAQRDQVQRIWTEGQRSGAERVASTRAVNRWVADQIRALLNDEQRKRYDPAPPDGGAAFAKASEGSVEDWMPGGKKH